MRNEDGTNQFYGTGINNDKLALFAKIHESNDIACTTPVGKTSRRSCVKEILGGAYNAAEWLMALGKKA